MSSSVRHGVSVPPFGELSEPGVLAELAVRAEAAGWDGCFVWDHLMRDADETEVIGSTSITLAAIAVATTTIRFGAMVTPVARRRPQVLARELTALDRLSGGRLIVGLGLGVDRGGELSKFGEPTEPRELGRRLDAGAEFLVQAWSGDWFERTDEPFAHGRVRFLPRPVQQPHPPMWFAARGTADRPIRRAIRLGQGLDLVGITPERVHEVADMVAAERDGGLDGFDLVCPVVLGSGDPTEWADTPATWLMHEYPSPPDVDAIERAIADGPPR